MYNNFFPSFARYLKSKNFELVLISFYEDEIRLKKEYFALYDTIYMIKRTKIVSLFMSAFFALSGRPIQCGYYFSFAFLKQLRRTIKQELPDEFISHLLRMVPYLELTGQEKKSIVEMTDALSKTYGLSAKAKGSLIKKMIYKMELHLIRRYEKYVVARFPKVALVSEADVNYLHEQCGAKSSSLSLYTNGVDCLPYLPATYKNRKICFVGNMRTLQNQDAVLHFVQDIFPIIKKAVPDAVFTVIGAEPPESIRALEDGKNIIVTGFVDDIQSAVSDCCLAVAPVRVGCGYSEQSACCNGLRSACRSFSADCQSNS
ncbi:MAG: glycosyltransferase [Treponema sp.]|nr:glycosyltransferase [Treponema sp.]